MSCCPKSVATCWRVRKCLLPYTSGRKYVILIDMGLVDIIATRHWVCVRVCMYNACTYRFSIDKRSAIGLEFVAEVKSAW